MINSRGIMVVDTGMEVGPYTSTYGDRIVVIDATGTAVDGGFRIVEIECCRFWLKDRYMRWDGEMVKDKRGIEYSNRLLGWDGTIIVDGAGVIIGERDYHADGSICIVRGGMRYKCVRECDYQSIEETYFQKRMGIKEVEIEVGDATIQFKCFAVVVEPRSSCGCFTGGFFPAFESNEIGLWHDPEWGGWAGHNWGNLGWENSWLGDDIWDEGMWGGELGGFAGMPVFPGEMECDYEIPGCEDTECGSRLGGRLRGRLRERFGGIGVHNPIELEGGLLPEFGGRECLREPCEGEFISERSGHGGLAIGPEYPSMPGDRHSSNSGHNPRVL